LEIEIMSIAMTGKAGVLYVEGNPWETDPTKWTPGLRGPEFVYPVQDFDCPDLFVLTWNEHAQADAAEEAERAALMGDDDDEDEARIAPWDEALVLAAGDVRTAALIVSQDALAVALEIQGMHDRGEYPPR
jgi:hypothetical protein